LEGTATLNGVMLQANYYLARDLVVWKTWCTFTRFKSCREYLCQIPKTQLLEKHKNTKNAFFSFWYRNNSTLGISGHL